MANTSSEQKKQNKAIFYKLVTYLLIFLFCVIALSCLVQQCNGQSTSAINAVDKFYLTQYNKWVKQQDTTKVKLIVQSTAEIPFDKKIELLNKIIEDKSSPIYKAISDSQQTKAHLYYSSWFVAIGCLLLFLFINFKTTSEVGALLTFLLLLFSIIASIIVTYYGYYAMHSVELTILNTLLE
jgi:hypothetical protein